MGIGEQKIQRIYSKSDSNIPPNPTYYILLKYRQNLLNGIGENEGGKILKIEPKCWV